MTKMKKKWLSRALCGALAVALVSGTAIMSPVADIVGTNIIASAATYTGNVDASQLKNILSTVLLMMIFFFLIQYTLRPQRS